MKKIGIAVITALVLFTSCKDTKTELPVPPLASYWKPVVGKYIVYRLDSTVTTAFGVGLIVHSYRVKDSVSAEITDGAGRKGYSIIRKMTDVNGVGPYVANSTFSVVPDGDNWIEFTENNLKYMKLRNPISEGFQWKGNSFIDVTSINSPVRYLADWMYTYQNVEQPYIVQNKTYNKTITVLQRDETIPEGPFVNTAYKQRNYGREVYADSIGLIYKEFLHYIYQPPTSTRAGYYEDESYGVKLEILDHN